MLPRQQRGRHHHGDLGAGHGGDEGGAQRHLGLAEADIAADEPVHRPARAHIGQRVEDRLLLVLGLGIGEARGELLVEPFGRGHRLALLELALGRHGDELVGDVLDALLDPRLARLPGDAAQPVELHVGLLRAVARQHLDVLDRDEKLVALGIEHAQAVMRRAGDLERDQPVIAADAMLDMDHEVAGLEGRHLVDELVEIGAALGRTRQTVAEDVLLGDQCRVRQRVAMLEAEHGEADAACRPLEKSVPARHRPQRLEAALLQHALDPVGGAGAVGQDERAAAGALLRREMIAHGVEHIELGIGALGGEVAAGARPRVDGERRACRHREGRELRHAALGEPGDPLAVVEIELVRPHRAVDRRRAPRPQPFLARAVEIGDRRQPVVVHVLGLVVERHRRLGQVVEHRLEALVIERQPMLHADIAPPGADRVVERVVIGDRAELLAIAAAEALDRGVVEQHLVDRAEHDRIQRAGRALGQRIEAAEVLQRVAEEIEPHRRRRARRVEIDDAAADREFTGLAHRIGPGIAVAPEKSHQPVEGDAPAAAQRQDPVEKELARRHALDDRVHRRQHDPALAGGRRRRQPRQRVDAPAHDLGIGRDAVVRQAVPGRQRDRLDAGMEEGERRGGARHPPVIAADMEQARHRAARHQPAQHEGVMALGGAGDGEPSGGRCRRGEELLERAHDGLGR